MRLIRIVGAAVLLLVSGACSDSEPDDVSFAVYLQRFERSTYKATLETMRVADGAEQSRSTEQIFKSGDRMKIEGADPDSGLTAAVLVDGKEYFCFADVDKFADALGSDKGSAEQPVSGCFSFTNVGDDRGVLGPAKFIGLDIEQPAEGAPSGDVVSQFQAADGREVAGVSVACFVRQPAQRHELCFSDEGFLLFQRKVDGASEEISEATEVSSIVEDHEVALPYEVVQP